MADHGKIFDEQRQASKDGFLLGAGITIAETFTAVALGVTLGDVSSNVPIFTLIAAGSSFVMSPALSLGAMMIDAVDRKNSNVIMAKGAGALMGAVIPSIGVATLSLLALYSQADSQSPLIPLDEDLIIEQQRPAAALPTGANVYNGVVIPAGLKIG